MTEINQVLGVYSKNTEEKTGTGTTLQKAAHKTFYYVTRSEIDEYHVQPLNQQHVPSGLVTSLTKRQFLTTFTPEMDYYEKKTIPALRSLQAKILKGEELFSEGNLDEAEQYFAKALLLDPENPKASLGIGSILCNKQNFQKLSKIVSKLLNSDAVFLESQRKEFNIFAIALRKQELFEESINFYKKALEINKNDENLHFNLARAYFDSGNTGRALKHIDKALAIQPNLEWAHKFKKYIIKQTGK
ncbi:tetratricopeptide repeat protein [Desulfovibrio gilichinskyi]|uniref:Tetratricopeptide repeat-containing protein n=1 Tax=Desulfovibrio gilichinskyi TaxID=1519643 RepID=A0A1X7DP00_9BACT|nr:tetratricopeptide repeat protein [Desulfovibrio gilichinskyi]SMF18932.1 Tetratricopeptide repeat-containing protein [Desulfovibrio gilichinskyi]